MLRSTIAIVLFPGGCSDDAGDSSRCDCESDEALTSGEQPAGTVMLMMMTSMAVMTGV